MAIRRLSPLLILLAVACEPAENVQVQELPPLERSSIESRLGLPALQGVWPFAGWELAEGDTLGMEVELPLFGAIEVVEQKRDSIGGVYADAGGSRAPMSGEIRRDGVVALVAFPGGGEGRYLVGSVDGDTLWVESSTLGSEGEWRGDARAAFVRGAAAAAPFRRIRGMVAAAPVQVADDTLVAAVDSLSPPASAAGAAGPGAAPAAAGAAGETTQPRTEPEVDPEPEDPQPADEEPEPEPEPRPAPPVERRDPPRVLGEPVQRDNDLP